PISSTLSLHDALPISEAEALCDEVVILRGGKVLVHSSLTELRARARKQVRFAARQPANRLAESLRRKGLETTLDADLRGVLVPVDRKSTRLNSSHSQI